ncbi:heme exporter protein CcmD [Undibacterium sp.]|uniref:heme exporter protein CcmD n=1 Tax=Undibacterium sp. TaxID=1914977 RepID=UPI003751D71B
MIWENWSDFFAMGGYGLYVWGSLIVVAFCMFAEITGLVIRHKNLRTQLNQVRPHRKP